MTKTYAVTAQTTDKLDADQVKAILTSRPMRGRKWTADSLAKELASMGIHCSPASVDAVLSALVLAGVLEEVVS